MKRLAALLFIAPALVVSPLALADEAAPSGGGTTGLVLGGAYEFGGETIVGSGSDQLRAGQGINVNVGIYHRFENSPVSLRGTVGFKFSGADVAGTKFAQTRVPLELIGSYHFANEARVGAGFVMHVANKVSNDGAFPDVKFKDAGGLELEAGYKMLVGAVTLMDYKDEFGNKYKANSIGFRLVFEFGSPALQ